MKGLTKSYLYQIRKTGLAKIVFFALLFMQISMLLGEWGYRDGKLTIVEYLADNGYIMQIIAVVYAVMMVGIICSMDFMDKTMNYELMSGHTRAQVYMSKILVSILYGCIGYAVILAVPVIVGRIFLNLEYGVDVKELVLRGLISILPAARIICEFIFFAFVVRNAYVIMACGFFLFLGGQMLPEVLGDPHSVFLGVTCFSRLTQFESWTTYTLQDTVNMIRVFGYELSGGEIAGVIISSVIIGGFFLLIGYTFFKKDDLR